MHACMYSLVAPSWCARRPRCILYTGCIQVYYRKTVYINIYIYIYTHTGTHVLKSFKKTVDIDDVIVVLFVRRSVYR